MVTTEKRNTIRVVTSNAKPHGRSVAWLDIFMAVNQYRFSTVACSHSVRLSAQTHWPLVLVAVWLTD